MSETDPELDRCRRYGCRHQARDHGMTDGVPRCWRCEEERAWHPFTRRDRTAAELAEEKRLAGIMMARTRGRGPRRSR